jgi:hypothetical protein
MAQVYPIEAESWQAGDMAYCVRSRLDALPRLERGRVYRVSRAVKPSNIVHHGLQLEGVVAQNELKGFWSNCFIKLPKSGSRLEAIDRATEYTCEHYWRPRQIATSGNSINAHLARTALENEHDNG